MGVDVAAAGSAVGSVVVVGEGDAWRPEALGAPSKVGSLVGSCPWSTPSSAMPFPASFSLSLFLFTGLVSTSSTGEALKADCSPSSESSATSTGPCKGTEGTAAGSPGQGTTGAGIAGASGTVFTWMSSFLSILLFALLAQDSSRRAGCTARGCCRHAETVYLLLPERFYESFSSYCVSPAACCCCRVPAACF